MKINKVKKGLILILISMGIMAIMGCNGTKGKDSSIISYSMESGVYEKEFELTLKSNDGGVIYYTLDGTDPVTSDTRMKYDKKIKVEDRETASNVVSAVSPSLFCTNFSYVSNKNAICTIKAPSDDAVDKCTIVRSVLQYEDDTYSDTYTKTYFIGSAEKHIEGIEESCKAAGKSLAVISITMNYDDLFDNETGIYVKGDIFDKSLSDFIKREGNADGEKCRKLAANYNQRGRDWERLAHIDFIEMDGKSSETVLSQNCGVRIQGNYSRSDLQKSFRLYARKEYGNKKFDYPIFGEDLTDINGDTIDEFKTFVLRAGGNCAFTAKFNDTYWQTLCKELDCDTKSSRPCVVYLNGEYWGLYVLEEDYSNSYFESHYGVNKDDVIVYKGDAETYSKGYKLDEGELPEGETDESYYYRELLDFFKNHKDLKNDEDYAAFAELVDVQSCMDYFAAEVWINNKWDWPGKNWSMWKTANTDDNTEYADGKWRFSFYDMEFGGICGADEASTNTIKEDNYRAKGLLDKGTNNPAVLCFAYLMTNESFRTAYCDKLLSLSENIFQMDRATLVLHNFENVYGPLYPQFFLRYEGAGSENDASYSVYSIEEFLKYRSKYIQKMINWVNASY